MNKIKKLATISLCALALVSCDQISTKNETAPIKITSAHKQLEKDLQVALITRHELVAFTMTLDKDTARYNMCFEHIITLNDNIITLVSKINELNVDIIKGK